MVRNAESDAFTQSANGKRTAIYSVFHPDSGLTDAFKNIKSHRQKLPSGCWGDAVASQACVEEKTARGQLKPRNFWLFYAQQS